MGSPALDVAVVGGGITGLVAAHRLQRDGGLEVALFEASDRPGGKVRSELVAGTAVEGGPDAFLARGSSLPVLCAELGLGDRLVSPALGRAGVWSRGRVRPLPEGLSMGVPSRPAALAASGILSLRGAARAGLDLVLPPTAPTESTTVAEALERRFGREARERLVDPLVGGIYAGDTSRLGFADALPDLYAAATGSRSLLWATWRRPHAAGPGFQSISGGLQALTGALAAGLDRLHLGTQVTALRKLPGGGFEFSTPAGTHTARVVIVAAPAFAAARLLRLIDRPAADLLAAIDYTSVATIALAYPRSALRPTGTTGFLVPPREGRLLTAVTWVWEKWPHAGSGEVALIRGSVGRSGDDRWAQMDDSTLLDAVRRDLDELADLAAEPLEARVTRWEAAMPQYEVGHAARVSDIERRLARHPGLLVAGAAYRGIGLAACVAQAERAAQTVVGLTAARRAKARAV